MELVKIGGVPEHFNLAWYLTLKAGAYKDKGIHLRWKDYYGGTGEMAEALRNNEIDLAVILTEGIIKDIIDGNRSKIVQVFVESPLLWGIHVAAASPYKTVEDLKGTKAAISRYGSGSHLMAYINALQNGWDLDKDLHFEVIQHLEGAVDGLQNGVADYFMWEYFTTKPLVDQGVFRHVGNCPTPWPCFVIAATDRFIEEQSDKLKIILNIINTATTTFKTLPNISKTIAERYQQKEEDVQKWLSITEWSQSNISPETVESIQNTMFSIGVIAEKVSYSRLVWNVNSHVK
ncbi:MAG TPA: substrate-binding domain-containing protein [Flavobacteriaceae bacterium]|nr:substrate-binding domain-containing protein [Flavobacteriaceae bacterium]